MASAWTLDRGQFELIVDVPPNTRATVRVPRARLASVTESGGSLQTAVGILASRQDSDAVVIDIGSGRYRFASTWTGEARH